MGLFSNAFKILGEIFIDKDGAEKNLDSIVDSAENMSGKLGSVIKTVGKVGVAAIGAVASGVGVLTKQAVDNFAEYEQLIGGTELLFGEAFDYVKKASQTAYRDVQMSQNDYLQQVNGFAVGLKTALGGNEQLAGELATKIVKAEADVVAATGNSQEAVQNAFNGIMKSNFTMLDNLQLGITPTKEGFEDLISTVNKWNKANGKETKYTIDNLADCQSALIDYIEMQGLAGYASNEGATTIQGATAKMKASWENFLTGMSDSEADFGILVDGLVESVSGFAELMIPRLMETVPRLAEGLQRLTNALIPYLSDILSEIIPPLIETASALLAELIRAIPQILSDLYPVILNSAQLLLDSLAKQFGFASFDIGQKIEEIKNFFVNTWNAISDFWNGKVVPFWNGTKETASSVADWFSEKFDAISEFVSTNFDKIKAYWDEHLKPCFDAIGNLIKNVLVPAFQWVFQKIIYPTVKQVFDNIVDIWNNRLKPCFDFIVGFLQTVFVGAWNTATTFIKDSWNALKKTFTAIIDFVTNVFSGNWSKAWQNVGQIFGGVFDGIKAKAKLIINSLIDAINGFIGGFNKLKVPDWIPGIGGNGINIPLIPKLEKGGILERGQVGLLEGNGAEAVVPLDQNRKWISAVAQDMNQMSFGSNEQTQRIVELLETLVEIMPDAMKDAVSGMKLNVNNREFARMVKAVE